MSILIFRNLLDRATPKGGPVVRDGRRDENRALNVRTASRRVTAGMVTATWLPGLL
jgi:hypothetical protein